MWIRAIFIGIIWFIVVTVALFIKRYNNVRKMILITLWGIDIIYHMLFIIGSIKSLQSLWGMMVTGIVAVCIDIIMLIFTVKVITQTNY